MMSILVYLTFAVLTIIALVHVYWALGGCWPAQKRAKLPRVVVGSEAADMPPAALTIFVALLIFLAGVVPLIWTEILIVPFDRRFQAMVVASLALVFLVRGLVTYTPVAARYSMVEPFVTLNRRYYSPLCLAIGASFTIILFS